MKVSLPPYNDRQGSQGWMDWFRDLLNKINKVNTYEAAVGVTAIPASSTTEVSVSVPGLSAFDTVYVNKPTHQAGIGVANARASAANTLAITFMNATAGSINTTAETYRIMAISK